jgi:hypothetical protein
MLGLKHRAWILRHPEVRILKGYALAAARGRYDQGPDTSVQEDDKQDIVYRLFIVNRGTQSSRRTWHGYRTVQRVDKKWIIR